MKDKSGCPPLTVEIPTKQGREEFSLASRGGNYYIFIFPTRGIRYLKCGSPPDDIFNDSRKNSLLLIKLILINYFYLWCLINGIPFLFLLSVDIFVTLKNGRHLKTTELKNSGNFWR